MLDDQTARLPAENQIALANGDSMNLSTRERVFIFEFHSSQNIGVQLRYSRIFS